ncbi:hypothetical protein M0812_12373 [Anaeramoeba flamelloides]|uniref:Ribosomal protein L14 n=1 Tax=Anaeramoeba flamelloides TaxID=1746091 RepID=A0AAV7ZLZ2_9EUKA|nr:hypothetical protein M0812_12373 [Anaeramoeba flamelloides]
MTSKSNREDFIISDIWDKWILFKKNNNITIGRITSGNTNRVNILIKCQLHIRINNDTFFIFIKNTSQQLRKLNSSKRKEYLTRPLRCKFVLQSVSLLRHKLSTKFKAQKKSQIKAQNSASSKINCKN